MPQAFLQSHWITSRKVRKLVSLIFLFTNLADPYSLALQSIDFVGAGALSSTALFISGGVTCRFGRCNNAPGGRCQRWPAT